jgi:hypothetical protein
MTGGLFEIRPIVGALGALRPHNPVNDYHGYRHIMHRVTLAGHTPR